MNENDQIQIEEENENNAKIETTKIYVPINCKNKSKTGTKYMFLWNTSCQYLSDGTGKYEAKSYLDRNLSETAEDLSICTKHCSYRVRFKNGKRYEAASKLTKVGYVMTDLSNDKLSIKIEDESCDDDKCLIDSFRVKQSRKRKLKQPNNNQKKRRKKNETSSESESDSDEEDEDDDLLNSTSSDEDDTSKSKKKKKTEKEKEEKECNGFKNMAEICKHCRSTIWS